MVQVRIIKYLPSAAWKTLVSGSVELFHKFEKGHPERGCKMRGRWGKLQFSANTEIHALDMVLGIIHRQV